MSLRVSDKSRPAPGTLNMLWASVFRFRLLARQRRNRRALEAQLATRSTALSFPFLSATAIMEAVRTLIRGYLPPAAQAYDLYILAGTIVLLLVTLYVLKQRVRLNN